MSDMYCIVMDNGNYLYHSGVKGQRWGVRRWQNPDGSLTAAGVQHYAKYGGSISGGKYHASNGITIAKGNNRGVEAFRRFSTTAPGYALSRAGAGRMAKLTGRSKESINKQADMERAALKEYYKSGANKALARADKAAKKTKQNEIKKNFSSKTKAYQKKESKGKALVKAAVLGDFGRKQTYDVARAAGNGRVKSYVKSMYDINLGSIISKGAGTAIGTGVAAALNKKLGPAGSVAVGSMAGIASNLAISKQLGDLNQVSAMQKHTINKYSKKQAKRG